MGAAPRAAASALGRRGEDAAAEWYLGHGYEVLARNWRHRRGEVDLVCRRGPLIVFCEVKARSTSRFGTPFEAVTRPKRLRVRAAAAAWMSQTGMHGPVRFDVAGVEVGRVEVIESAF